MFMMMMMMMLTTQLVSASVGWYACCILSEAPKFCNSSPQVTVHKDFCDSVHTRHVNARMITRIWPGPLSYKFELISR